MDAEIPHVEVDRTQVMLILYAQGHSFAEMVSPLRALGLLRCQEDHRKRACGGATDCATCENTVLATWRRHMKAIGATKEDLAEVKGAWFTAHMAVEGICAKRYLKEVVTETTRTEVVDGKEVTITTVQKETHINVALLRLWCEIRDKITRMGGVNVKNPASARLIPRRLLNPVKRDPHDERGDGPAN